jgi:predicted amidohydrolase
MRPFAVAGIQMLVTSRGDNLTAIEQQVDQLTRGFPWVQMVFLSELAVTGPLPSRAVPIGGSDVQRLQQVARDHHIWFVPGSLYERDGDHVYNTTPIIAPSGDIVKIYRKMFPFRPYEPGVEPGREFVVFDVPQVGRFGVLICYDIWFPETARTLVSLGAEVLLHPSLTTTIDREIELAIVRATAACQQCFVLDVNGLGEGGNGRSIFAGPAGDVLHQAGTHIEDIPMEIDLDRVSRSREVGLRGLGQPLKSFRDRLIDLPIYARGATTPYLDSLGKLELAQRGSRAGIDGAQPVVLALPAEIIQLPNTSAKDPP